MAKVLKNIPKPNADKLALFYGQSPQAGKVSTVDKKSTVDKLSTVDKPATVDKKSTGDKMSTDDKLSTVDSRRQTKTIRISGNPKIVFDSLSRRAQGSRKETDLIGYSELAKELDISSRTIQRAVEKLINTGLIQRAEFANTADRKGSRYRILYKQG